MNDNKELNDNLQRLFSTIKDAYGIASMIKDIKEKEVGNKDYEIISLNDNGHILFLVHGGYSQGRYYPIYTLEQLIILGAKIRSVKRLSDNEVFEIGTVSDEGKIKEFYISENILWVRTEEKGGVVSINDIQKIKERKVLFYTEDNVPIFEGDRCWYMTEYFRIDFYDFIVHSKKNREHDLKHYSDYKYFSTEDKAKEYVYHKKPCLSYNDAVHWLASDGSGYGLYEIVKEKIDNK